MYVISRRQKTTVELHANKNRSSVDRPITSVTSLNEQLMLNESIREEFRHYFQNLCTRKPYLTSSQFVAYLADFFLSSARLKRIGTKDP